MNPHYAFWEEKDKEDLNKVKSFQELADIGLRIINRISGDVHVVSGPISTGGAGNPKDNLKIFKNVVELLFNEGLNVLSWVPFETKIHQLHLEWIKMNGETYCMPILEVFYNKMFSSGRIKKSILFTVGILRLGHAGSIHCAKN